MSRIRSALMPSSVATSSRVRVAELAAAPDDWVKWRVMGNVLRAVDTNRSRLKLKARWLAVGQAALLVTLLSLGAYFVYGLVGGL